MGDGLGERMKISKPDCLELMVRPYRWRGQSRIGLSVIVAVDASSGQAVLAPDSQLWDVAEQCFETGGVIDMGIPKVHPEFLVSGHAYTHFQEDKTRCLVGVQVNDKQKELLVIGDRYSIDGRLSDPQPFDTMPLSWTRAYGGEGHPNNPLGKGAQETLVDGIRTHLMPNIEWPHRLITNIQDKKIQTAGFGARDISWPVRFNKVGTYSKGWLEQDFPGFLPDMDPTLFNAAMDDQIWFDAHHFPSEVEFAVSHMHPSLPIWRGTVPMFTGRCLLQLQAQDELEPRWHDVSLKLKTLWLVPHLQTYFLVYQDSVPARDDDGDEIKHVLAALEWQYSPKPFEHYQDYMLIREDHDKSALLAYEDEQLLPENIAMKGYENLPTPHAIMWEKQEKFKHYIRQQAQQQLNGMDLSLNDFVPEFVGPEAPLDMQKLLDKQKLINQRSLDLQTQREQIKQANKRFKLSKGQDKEFLSLLNAESLKDKILSEETQTKAPNKLQLSPALQSLASAQQAENPALAQQQTKRIQQTFTMSAHLRGEQFIVDEHLAKQLRQQAQGIASTTKDFSGVNLERADLSNLVFEDCNFGLCSLAHADLTQTQFIRCRFEQTAFSYAQLVQTMLIACEFTGSNFHQSHWQRVEFQDCQLTRLMAQSAQFEACHFERTLMEETIWHECEFVGNDFYQCRLDGCAWQAGEIVDTQFTDCHLEKAAFNEVSFERVMWQQSHLYRLAFADCVWQNVKLQECKLEAMALIGEEPLQSCDFLACQMSLSSMREQQFIECDFRLSRIENSDMSKSQFVQCSFQQSELPDALLRRSSFDRVDFSQANLMQANFNQARFMQCLFMQTNFHASDFSQTDIDADSLEQGNYMQGIQLEPRFRESQS